ncbi:uncharacterized protein TNCV_2316721 [Trichonephila clavipes]|nr:uncharacterized protein TNCV_2316721 [Trichonephila clavipes]
MSVEEFDYEIEHRAGSRMKHVDALSQYPVRIVCNDTLTSKLKKAQEEADNIETLKSLLEKQESEEFFERNDTDQSTPEEIVLRMNLENEEAENLKNHYSALSNTNWFVYYCNPNPQRKMETKK